MTLFINAEQGAVRAWNDCKQPEKEYNTDRIRDLGRFQALAGF